MSSWFELCDLTQSTYCQFDACASTSEERAIAWVNCHSTDEVQSGKSNRIVLINKIDKAVEGNWGPTWDDPALFFGRKMSAARGRNLGLDSSAVTYIATANNLSKKFINLHRYVFPIPVPLPTMAHLPTIAEQVIRDLARVDGMRDLARVDGMRRQYAPLRHDELEKIGPLWRRENFSLRALSRLVSQTLDARERGATRH